MERSSLSWKLALENFAITRVLTGVSGKDVIKLETTSIHEMFALLTMCPYYYITVFACIYRFMPTIISFSYFSITLT